MDRLLLNVILDDKSFEDVDLEEVVVEEMIWMEEELIAISGAPQKRPKNEKIRSRSVCIPTCTRAHAHTYSRSRSRLLTPTLQEQTLSESRIFSIKQSLESFCSPPDSSRYGTVRDCACALKTPKS